MVNAFESAFRKRIDKFGVALGPTANVWQHGAFCGIPGSKDRGTHKLLAKYGSTGILARLQT